MILIAGLFAAGKTTLATGLSHQLQLPHFDTADAPSKDSLVVYRWLAAQADAHRPGVIVSATAAKQEWRSILKPTFSVWLDVPTSERRTRLKRRWGDQWYRHQGPSEPTDLSWADLVVPDNTVYYNLAIVAMRLMEGEDYGAA